MRTEYDNICLEYEIEIKKWLLEQGSLFNQKIRKFLSQFDKDINPELKDKQAELKVSLGTFSYTNRK